MKKLLMVICGVLLSGSVYAVDMLQGATYTLSGNGNPTAADAEAIRDGNDATYMYVGSMGAAISKVVKYSFASSTVSSIVMKYRFVINNRRGTAKVRFIAYYADGTNAYVGGIWTSVSPSDSGVATFTLPLTLSNVIGIEVQESAAKGNLTGGKGEAWIYDLKVNS